MANHAMLSPSSAERWCACPGSAFLSKNVERTTSAAAEEGTKAHQIAYDHIVNGVPIPTDNRFSAVGFYTEYVKKLIAKVDPTGVPHGLWGAEREVSITCVTGEEDAKGTVDFYAIDPIDGVLYVVDLKFGQGTPVKAERNKQLSTYAYGLLHRIKNRKLRDKIRKICLVICQVREDPEPKEWWCSKRTLKEFIDILKSLALTARMQAQGKLPLSFAPSQRTCQYCPVQMKCRAYASMVQAATGIPLCDILSEEYLLSKEELANIYLQLNDVEAWASSIRKKVTGAVLGGEKYPGLKVIRGRPGNRAWSDTAVADKVMISHGVPEDTRYRKKIISVATAEKLHKSGLLDPRAWTILQGYITRPEGKLAVVAETDPRPEVELDDGFDYVNP